MADNEAKANLRKALLFVEHDEGAAHLKTINSMNSISEDEGNESRARQCTDVGCSLFFLVSIGLMVWLNSYARENGEWARLTHGFNWNNDLCGGSTSPTKDSPYLFWCQKNLLARNLSDGICVKSCPSSTETSHYCPGPPTQVRTYQNNDGSGSVITEVKFRALNATAQGSYTVTMGVKRDLVASEDYNTTELLGYCLPSYGSDLFKTFMSASSTQNAIQQVVLGMSYLQQEYHLVLWIGVFAMALGYFFLFVVNQAVMILMIVMIVLVDFALLISGGGLIYFAQCSSAMVNGTNVPNCLLDVWPTTALYRDNQASFTTIGGIILVLWLVATICLCCAKKAITDVAEALKNSAVLVAQMPTLLLQPLVQVIIKLPLLMVLCIGLAWLVSLGKPTPMTLTDTVTGSTVSGMNRHFEFSNQQWTFICLWIYGTVWIIETISALGQFVISHAVVVHVVEGQHNWFPLAHGYFNGVVYHMGTIAFGGFVLGTLRIINFIVSMALKNLKSENKDGKSDYSCVTKVLCCCCLCCMKWLESTVEMINDLVYTECALNGKGYIGSISNVGKQLGDPTNLQGFAILQTAVSFFKTLGILTITGLCTYFSYVYMKQVQVTATYAGIVAVSLAAGVVSLFVSLALMNAFCQAAITAWYVNIWLESHSKETSLA